MYMYYRVGDERDTNLIHVSVSYNELYPVAKLLIGIVEVFRSVELTS